jgi:hypothetical protein
LGYRAEDLVLIVFYEFFEALKCLQVALTWRERGIRDELNPLEVLHS